MSNVTASLQSYLQACHMVTKQSSHAFIVIEIFDIAQCQPMSIDSSLKNENVVIF